MPNNIRYLALNIKCLIYLPVRLNIINHDISFFSAGSQTGY